MAIRLYSWPMSSGSRIVWALEELGVPYEYIGLDRAKNEHRAAEYLAVNPNGKVPGLVDGEHNLFESAAILAYLGERYGVEQGLWPQPGPARSEALSWTVWATAELVQYLMQYLYHGLDTPFSYKPEDRSKATAEYNRGEFERHLDMLEARLQGRNHLMGDFTLVDIPSVSTVMFGKMLGAPIEGRPAVTAWLSRCGQRPAFSKIR
jgi:glutathione S-transferase